ncbi:response regulator transcription factor [Geodermatophilus sp. SYSU D00691]
MNGQPAAGVRIAAPATPPLSARELEVLRLLDEGRSTAQIAAALAVSTNTVRGHVRTLLRKLAATGRDDAVRRARELSRV